MDRWDKRCIAVDSPVVPMPDWDEMLGEGWRIRFVGPKHISLTDLQFVHLYRYILYLMEKNGYTDTDVSKALNCSSAMVKKITGRLGGQELTGISFHFLKRVALFCLNNPQQKTVWAPIMVPPGEETILVSRVLIRPTQCMECIYDHNNGKISWEDTWWVKNPKSKFCTPLHKTRWHKRHERAKYIRKRRDKAEREFDRLYSTPPAES